MNDFPIGLGILVGGAVIGACIAAGLIVAAALLAM
jgi:hypothetical protein